MSIYKLGKDPSLTKELNGEVYIFSMSSAGKELWLPLIPVKKRICASCGYDGIALDEHHIYGRKNSDETITLCSNCHREYHAGVRTL